LQFCNQNCLSKIAVACLADKIGANRFTYLYFFIVGATELLDISSDISSCRLSGKRRAPISLPCISVCAIMSSSYHMAMSLFQPLPTAAQLESDRHHIWTQHSLTCCHMLSHCGCPNRNCPKGGACFQISTGFQTLLLP
jgi:hypothetical protein